MIFGGKKVHIGIEVDPAQGPYYAGDLLHVLITLQSEKELKVREARASLMLHETYSYTRTEGGKVRHNRGTSELIAHRAQLLGEETIPAGFNQTYRLEWQIPQEVPPPYTGKLITGRWLIKVTLDRKLRGDINEELEIPLIVPPPGRWARPGDYGESSHPDDAEMVLWLPRLEWVEGETIEGKLKVYAQKDISASGVRIELVRRERVSYGDGETSAATEFKERIAGGVKLNAGEVGEFPFSVPIPERGCPTRSTPIGRVSWELKGILDRRLRKDFTVTQEVYVFNGVRL